MKVDYIGDHLLDVCDALVNANGFKVDEASKIRGSE